MNNYVIYGSGLSGFFAYKILRNRGINVVGFVDITGKMNCKFIPDKYKELCYRSVHEFLAYSCKVDKIIVSVGSRLTAYEIKETLNNEIDNLNICTIYDDEFIKEYLDMKYEYENINVPKIFYVETILGCNLKCPECPEGDGVINRARGAMRFEDFKIIADKIKPYTEYLFLFLWGEPLLNKDIIKIIKYASQFTKTCISTNGILLTENKAEELITSGITDIIFSIDAATKETYDRYRIAGDFDKSIRALKLLQDYNVKYGSKVNISPQFIVFKHNQHEMRKFKNLCESIGLEPVFKKPYIRKNDKIQESSYPEFIRTEFNEYSKYVEALTKCECVRDVFTILLDGSVIPCCYDYDGKLSYGNIFSEDAWEIWQKDEYVKFRNNVIKGDLPKLCSEKCMLCSFKKI